MRPADPAEPMAEILLALCLAAILAPLGVYPLVVLALGRLYPVSPPPEAAQRPRTTILIAFTGSSDLLARKLANLVEVTGRDPVFEVVLACDGPVDPEALAGALAHTGDLAVSTVSLDRPSGKAYALNRALQETSGEILVFTDLDAELGPGALDALLRWFQDPRVGAVCGRRTIRTSEAIAHPGQRTYADLDSRIKLMENRLGAITSNDGKLYALRRDLARPIHPAATDDLYNLLSVVDQGYRVLFEPAAEARIPPPAATIGHDLARRRRITVRSLAGIMHRPRLLSSTRFALFGPRFLVNKLLRRLLPFSLTGCLAALGLLAVDQLWAAATLLLLLTGAIGIGAFALVDRIPLAAHLPEKVHRLWASAFYAALGFFGMGLGVIDFLRGRRISHWTPRKLP
jgi:cellulose synthase/poly-beta-1,6-N-acetylglucosamine synthase-like glycosyltransferase